MRVFTARSPVGAPGPQALPLDAADAQLRLAASVWGAPMLNPSCNAERNRDDKILLRVKNDVDEEKLPPFLCATHWRALPRLLHAPSARRSTHPSPHVLPL